MPQGDISDKHLVVVGAGLSGLATALGAALRGWRVTVFEADDKVGGAAAYSGGLVWVGANHAEERLGIADDLELVEKYIRAIGADRPDLLDEAAMHQWLRVAPTAARYWEDVGAISWTVIRGLADYHEHAPGAIAEGRYITADPVEASDLGEWRNHLNIGPYHPMGTTYADALANGRRQTHVARTDGEKWDDRAMVSTATDGSGREDEISSLTFGTGVVASFLKRVRQEDGIEILTKHRVAELLTSDGKVVGARAEGPDGDVVRHGPVVLATSSYDWHDGLIQEFLGIDVDDFGSVAPRSIRGDGIQLARSVGAETVTMPPSAVPMMPGWESEVGTGYSHGPEACLPHTVIVDRSGQRFCDDSYWVDILAKAFDPDDPHWPMFLVWDDNHRQKYGLQTTPPGGQYPEGLVTSASTLGELGANLGIDGEQLEATVGEFNQFAKKGEDPRYGRGTMSYIVRNLGDPHHEPNPLLGPIRQAPFHGLRLKVLGTGIGMSGVSVDARARVLSSGCNPIEGLYSLGSCAAFTTSGTGYNSGFALSRAITFAYVIAHELASSQ